VVTHTHEHTHIHTRTHTRTYTQARFRRTGGLLRPQTCRAHRQVAFMFPLHLCFLYSYGIEKGGRVCIARIARLHLCFFFSPFFHTPPFSVHRQVAFMFPFFFDGEWSPAGAVGPLRTLIFDEALPRFLFFFLTAGGRLQARSAPSARSSSIRSCAKRPSTR